MPGQVLRKFELTTYQFECDILTCWVICNTLYMYELIWGIILRMHKIYTFPINYLEFPLIVILTFLTANTPRSL